MNIAEAKKFVNAEISRIEAENPVGELRPWERDACEDALKHWGLVQQRIALNGSNPQSTACCDSLNLEVQSRKQSEAQKAGLAAARAIKTSILRQEASV